MRLYWKEKDKALEISLYQYGRLKELGVNVELTRNEDVYLSPNDRTRIIRESKADICISNHINESDNYKGQDYYYMHRRTGNVQTVIIEYGFADNAEDTQKILEYWKKYAESVVKTLCIYLGVDYTYENEVVNYKELYIRGKEENEKLTNKLTRIQKIIEE